jgi:hypothetical protein
LRVTRCLSTAVPHRKHWPALAQLSAGNARTRLDSLVALEEGSFVGPVRGGRRRHDAALERSSSPHARPVLLNRSLGALHRPSGYALAVSGHAFPRQHSGSVQVRQSSADREGPERQWLRHRWAVVPGLRAPTMRLRPTAHPAAAALCGAWPGLRRGRRQLTAPGQKVGLRDPSHLSRQCLASSIASVTATLRASVGL